jgi:3'(2'), 5'-bisphosphate nucleotidase
MRPTPLGVQLDVSSSLSVIVSYLGFWTLDPVDGTSGFLRGGQYAICLALIIDGIVKVGVLGCPNLPTSFNDPTSDRGVLVFGMSGDKAFESSLNNHVMIKSKACEMKKVEDITQATFCESVESGHSSHEEHSEILKLLGIKTSSVRMDSQAKYAELTRGDAEIYLRLPVSMKYEEKIWVFRQYFKLNL